MRAERHCCSTLAPALARTRAPSVRLGTCLLGGLLAFSLTSGCDDAASTGTPEPDSGPLRDRGGPAPTRDAAPPDQGGERTRDAASDALVPLDAAFDAAPPDEETECLAEHGVVAVGGPTILVVDTAGRARAYDRDRQTLWAFALVDEVGAPIAKATVALVPGPQGWSALLQPEGRVPAIVVGPYADSEIAVSAIAQLQRGIGEVEVVTPAPAGLAPDCLTAPTVVSVNGEHAPTPRAWVAQTVGDWIARCAGAPEALAAPCAVLNGMEGGLEPASTGPLRLSPSILLRWEAMAGLPLPAADAARALRAETCARVWGAAVLTWLTSVEGEHPLQTRYANIRSRLVSLLTRLATEPPADEAATIDDLTQVLTALASVGALVRPGGMDSHGPDLEGAGRVNALTDTAARIKRLAIALGLADQLAFGGTYDALLLAGPAVTFDGLGLRRTVTDADRLALGDGLECRLAGIPTLRTTSGVVVDTERAIGHMLDVLDAAGDAVIERRWGPPPVDAEVDAGVVDAGPDAAAPPDAAPEVDAAPEPDAGIGPACAPDRFEPNDAWRGVVGEGRHQPIGGATLDGLTLLPGDEDWYAFEVNRLNLNISARLSPSNRCDGVDQRICMELFWYSWVNAEGLIDDSPIELQGPFCGQLSAGLFSGSSGAAALAGEPWASIVVRVYREAPAPGPASYRLDVTH